jgi:hypothetical protein
VGRAAGAGADPRILFSDEAIAVLAGSVPIDEPSRSDGDEYCRPLRIAWICLERARITETKAPRIAPSEKAIKDGISLCD